MNSRLSAIVAVGAAAGLSTIGGAVFGVGVGRAATRSVAVASSPSATATPTAAVSPLTPDTFRGVAKRETAGVVNISTTKIVKHSEMEDPLRFFFGRPDHPFLTPGPREGRQTETSLGSGFVVDKDGYILTNRHVVADADHVQVTFPDGKKYEARIAGQDQRTDVALLKIEPREALTVIPLGDSGQAEVGEWVMAIGNPFGLGGNSVTVGVVSYQGRPLDLASGSTPVDMIQTDASINPGNSGGPLLNTRGQAIGISTLIITQGVAQSSGVGFAVPIDVAKEILPQLRSTGKVVRGWLGVQVQSLDENLATSFKLHEAKGALVSDTTPNGPAAHAGVKPGDVVVALNGQPISSSSELSSRIASDKPGTKVALQVMRDGTTRSLEATLGTFPDAAPANDSATGDHGPIGLSLQTVTPDLSASVDLPAGTEGVYVADVAAGSKAESAGLRPGDVIQSVDDDRVATPDAFEAALASKQNGGLHRLRVLRGSGHLFLVLDAK